MSAYKHKKISNGSPSAEAVEQPGRPLSGRPGRSSTSGSIACSAAGKANQLALVIHRTASDNATAPSQAASRACPLQFQLRRTQDKLLDGLSTRMGRTHASPPHTHQKYAPDSHLTTQAPVRSAQCPAKVHFIQTLMLPGPNRSTAHLGFEAGRAAGIVREAPTSNRGCKIHSSFAGPSVADRVLLLRQKAAGAGWRKRTRPRRRNLACTSPLAL